MDEAISYEELRRVQTLERDNKALQDLDNSFFKKVGEYISSKEKIIAENKDKENIFSKQTFEKNEQELKNVKKIIEDICSRRRRKIAIQALNNVTAKVHNTEHMLSEEEVLYARTIELIKSYNDAFNSKFQIEKDIAEFQETEKSYSEPEKKLTLVGSLPAFAWKDGAVYGPFEAEQVVELPKEVGEILIKEGKAILV